MRNSALAVFAGFGDFDPVMISPDQEARVTACLRALAEDSHAKDMLAAQNANYGPTDDFWNCESWEARYRPYVVKDGVLLVPVKGVLLHNFPYAVGNYATGYYYIQKAIERGTIDSNVKGIALVCDSPGGHVAGCFELVDKIYQARSAKPIAAFAHEHAYSAAYAIASAAKKITVSRTGGVGSIGVVTMHVDYSEMMKEAGVKVTFIFAGKYKVEGNAYEPLSDAAKQRIQDRIDESYAVFVGAVARNRGIEEKAVRSTEALTFTASAAVDRSLADNIGPLDDALAEFVDGCSAEDGEDEMTATQATQPAGVTQEAHDAAVRDAAAAAATSAANAAKERIKAITGCDEAKDRPKLAHSIAMDTDMDAAQAKIVLAAAAKEVAATQTNDRDTRFNDAMAGGERGPGGGAPAPDAIDLSTDAGADAEKGRLLASVFGSAEPPAGYKRPGGPGYHA